MPNEPLDFELDSSGPSTSVPTVTVGVFPGALPPSPYQPNDLEAPYDGFGITVSYVDDLGLRGAPVSAAYRTKAAFWRAHGGHSWKVVTWVVQRHGAIPQMPHIDTGSGNDVLFFRLRSPAMPGKSLDGDPYWVIVGQYIYMMQLPPAETDPLPVAIDPISGETLTTNRLNPSDFVQNLIGPVPDVTGYTGPPITF